MQDILSFVKVFWCIASLVATGVTSAVLSREEITTIICTKSYRWVTASNICFKLFENATEVGFLTALYFTISCN